MLLPADPGRIIHASGSRTLSHSARIGWCPCLNYWVPASKLKKGEHLQTADGVIAVADGGTTPKVHTGDMRDLTVPGNNDHDFYVVVVSSQDAQANQGAASASILVHNHGIAKVV